MEINTVAESDPRRALDLLDSVDYTDLSERERNYYDFLRVKSERRGYLPAESDSLILKVIDHARKHKSDGYYAEALYTGGLVYMAMGDHPTALTYFNQALKEVSADEQNLLLREKINSQAGKLLTNLRLNEEAESHIKEAIRMAKARKDTFAIESEYQLYAANLQKSRKWEAADSVLKLLVKEESHQGRASWGITLMYLATQFNNRGKSDSARYYIRQAIELIPEYARNSALAYGAQIYQKEGMMDSACFYATALIHSPYEEGKVCGYQILLSPEAREGNYSVEELDSLYAEYTGYLQRYLDENSMKLIREQEASYNYKVHEENRARAEAASYKRGMWLAIAAVIILVLILINFLINIRRKKDLIRLQAAISEIKRLRIEISLSKERDQGIGASYEIEGEKGLMNSKGDVEKREIKIIESDKDRLRSEFQKELFDLYRGNPLPEVSEILLKSEVYKRFLAAADLGEPMGVKSEDWEELEEMVNEVSPDFITRLSILSVKDIKPQDLHIALLIKCGFRVTDIARIVSLSKGTITYRRKRMAEKFFDTTLDYEQTEALIRLI